MTLFFEVGDQAAWIVDQVPQHVLGLRGNGHPLLASPEALVRYIEAESLERFHSPNLTRLDGGKVSRITVN